MKQAVGKVWVGALMACAVTGMTAQAQSNAGEDTYINVRDYIRAAGNPKDHTEAIRQAVERQNEERKVLFFPPGGYVISDTIDIGGGRIEGKQATIAQTDPEKDVFRSTRFPHLHISGINFRGGRHQIWLGGGYEGGHLIKITDCNFYDSSGWAIYIDSNMCVAMIERGVMMKCAGLVYAATDSVVIRDYFVIPWPNADYPAAFDMRAATTIMENCLLNPAHTYGDSRWIDNRSPTLIVRDVRFSGEGGGFTPIVNYARYSPGLGTRIIVENSMLLNQSNLKRFAGIYLEEIPNNIIIRNSTFNGIPPIAVSDRIDLARYFEKGRAPLHLSYVVEDSLGYIGDIPKLLRKPVIHERRDEEQLTENETRDRMNAAMAEVKEMRAATAVGESSQVKIRDLDTEHIEQTDPDRYVEARPDQYSLTGYVDGGTVRNAEFFAIAGVEDDLIIMPRLVGTGSSWVLLEGFTVDVDRHPILTRKVKSASSYHQLEGLELPIWHGHYRIIDRETGMSQLIWSKYEPYSAIDLRKHFGGGVRTFDIRIYASLSWRIPHQSLPQDFRIPEHWRVGTQAVTGTAPLGSYRVLDYIRAEMEN